MFDLQKFMAEHDARLWQWGVTDCSLVLADWVVANGGSDPAVDWRGAYADEMDWRRIVTERGGLHPLVSDVCARAGLETAATPSLGAIGVIGASRNIERQWGAIFDGARWQVRLVNGFGPVMARPLGIWKVA